ncbi:MAG TPA: hypothetical protein PKC28_12520 [Bdellovibrionales bacterium]|nr:hypothetical protein [Bdellovibrionales bacterium]
MAVAPTQTCPRCRTLTDTLVPVDAGVRLALTNSGETGHIADAVCPSCFEQITGAVSQGLKLRMERDVREKNKMMMWKNRVHLIKNARNLMAQKSYSEAAVQYEKYLRVLEVVYNLKKGELSPAVFNNSSRSKELTVVASVYWDLLRIYDTHPRYADRMSHAGSRLAQFLPFSPIYPDIVKKAEQFARGAKNQAGMREFLKLVKSSRGPCFIADAAFAENPYAVELHVLRRFRDESLRLSPTGRRLIWAYYRLSPPVARWIGRSQLKSRVARWALTKIARPIKKSLNSP